MSKELDHLRDYASEHCDDYLIVVIKENKIYHTYKSNTSAYGMAALVINDAQKHWQHGLNNKLDE